VKWIKLAQNGVTWWIVKTTICDSTTAVKNLAIWAIISMLGRIFS